jgi:hypothetical protein
MLKQRSSLIICLIVATIGILCLGPINGATFNGQNTFLLTIEQKLSSHPKCNFVYSSGAMYCMSSFSHAYDLGIILCGLLGLLIFFYVIQLVRLDVRKNHNS